MSEFFNIERKPKINNISKKLFLKANQCWLCEQILDVGKQAQYCKLSGDYLVAAHQSCIDRINKKNQYKCVHVLFHNFSKYDIHLFFKQIIDMKSDEIRLFVLPITNEE